MSGAAGYGTRARLRRLAVEDEGQVMPIVTFMLLALFGMMGLALDTGRAMYTRQELQAANDAAALAGAQALPTANALTQATAYSAVAGGKNVQNNLSHVVMVSGYPRYECLTTIKSAGLVCSGAAAVNNANAIQVKEQMQMPLYFGAIFGVPNWTISVLSTAAGRGSNSTPYNIAILMDLTLSMNFTDSDCGNTQIGCALSGMQTLLQDLDPCSSVGTCSISNGVAANSIDRVSVFTFPQQQENTIANNYNCGGSLGNANVYTFPSSSGTSYTDDGQGNTYQITGFLSDYKTSNGATSLNSSSNLTAAAGGKANCTGMAPPNYAGYVGTYYAASIYAAQAALANEKAANPGSQNIMIILSDGDATAPQTNPPGTPIQNCKQPNCIIVMPTADGSGNYPSYVGECGQAIAAAQTATAAGTRVYTIGYGSEPVGCASDTNAGSHPNISPCGTMAAMASSSQYFYSDYKQTGSGSTCVASQPATSINDIFAAIAGDLSHARLIPDGTQ